MVKCGACVKMWSQVRDEDEFTTFWSLELLRQSYQQVRGIIAMVQFLSVFWMKMWSLIFKAPHVFASVIENNNYRNVSRNTSRN